MKKMKKLMALVLAAGMIISSNSLTLLAEENSESAEVIQTDLAAEEAQTTQEAAVEETLTVQETPAEEVQTTQEAVVEETLTVQETPTEEASTEEVTAAEETAAEETAAEDEAVLAEEPAADEPAEEVTQEVEETAEESKTEFVYEDSRVKVTAVAKPEANLPQNAELKAVYLSEGSDEYTQAVNAVTAQMSKLNQEFVDFVCYDVYFEVDGVEIEPEEGSVTVTMEYKQPQLAETTEEITEYATYHIVEDTNVVEDVTGTVNTNSDGAVTSVEFSTESFSVIVSAILIEPTSSTQSRIQYSAYNLGETVGTNRFKVRLKYTDDDGKEHVVEQLAYCLESKAGTPVVADPNDQTVIDAQSYKNIESPNLENILYYGYNGAGDLSDTFFKEYAEQIKAQVGDSVYAEMKSSAAKRADYFYILTHVAASYEYYKTLGNTNAEAKEYAYTGMNDAGVQIAEKWRSYLIEQKEYGLTLWKVEGKKSTEITSISADLYQNETYKVTGDTGTLEITIPAGVVCTVNGEEYRNTTVGINPGSTFKFSVDAIYSGDIDSINVNYNQTINNIMMSKSLQVIAIHFDESKLDGWGDAQDIGVLSNITSDNSVNITFTWKKAALQVTKTDDANQVMTDVKFEVYNNAECSGSPLTTITTDANGKAYLEMTISGDIVNNTVYLKEIIPEGYIGSGVVAVKLQPTGSGETTKITSVKIINKAVTGTLKVQKVGEVLSGVTGEENLTFTYTNGSLKGAEFALYKKDDLNTAVATLVTDEAGYAEVSGIALGEYILKETKAPAGYVQSDVKYPVTFTYKDQNTAVIVVDYTGEAALGNQRQKFELTINKVAADDKVPLAGAKFGLYAAEEIKAGETIVPKDTLLGTAISDENGNAVFTQDLPIGKYYLKELIAPTGYVASEEIIDVDLTKVGSTSAKIEFNHTVENDDIETEVVKVDADGNKVAGAELVLKAAEDVYDAAGKLVYAAGDVVEQFTSDSENVKVIGSKLNAGYSYMIEETKAPEGYAYTEPVEFTVNLDGTVTLNGETLEDGTILIVDNKLDVLVDKVDNADNQVAGAKLALYGQDESGNYTIKITEWTTEIDKVYDLGSMLEAGKSYILKELDVPLGYCYAEDIYFTINKDGSVETTAKSITDAEGNTIYVMTDDPLKLYVDKVDSKDHKKEIVGAELTLYGCDANGKFTIEIDKWVSAKDEIHDLSAKIKAGNTYLLRETKTPKGYETAADILFKVEKDGTIVTKAEKYVKEDGTVVYVMEDKAVTEKNSVKTGDSSSMAGWGMLMLMAAVVVAVTLRKRRMCR